MLQPSPGLGPATQTPGAGGETAPTAAAATSSAAPSQPELRPGLGTCRVDDDCALGHSRNPAHYGDDACCIRFCPPGQSISRAVLQQEEAWVEHNCKSKSCGHAPPAPCRPSEDRVFARCVESKCMTEVHRAPPSRPSVEQ
jgi:hypothetical protein